MIFLPTFKCPSRSPFGLPDSQEFFMLSEEPPNFLLPVKIRQGIVRAPNAEQAATAA